MNTETQKENSAPWINPNESVEVRLTKKGKDVWREHYSGYETLRADANSEVFKTQFWILMEVFGPHSYIGGDVFFDFRPITKQP